MPHVEIMNFFPKSLVPRVHLPFSHHPTYLLCYLYVVNYVKTTAIGCVTASMYVIFWGGSNNFRGFILQLVLLGSLAKYVLEKG